MARRNSIRVEPLTSSIGAEVPDVDLNALDDAQCLEIRSALSDHGVLVFRGQVMSEDEQCAFGARFGPSHGHPVRQFLKGGEPNHPLELVENDADKPPQEDQNFHTDYSFNTVIPDLAILRADVIPRRGGDTIWSSTIASYEGLSSPVKGLIDGLVALHEPSERFWFEYARVLGEESVQKARKAFPGAEHPVVECHPFTGRPLLFVNCGYTTRILGVTPRESRSLLNMLFDQLKDPAFHYRHKWRPGDVVMWDEHSTVHMGPHDFFPEHRRLTRVTAGYRAPTRVPVLAA
jgi:taurine dioxygenase